MSLEHPLYYPTYEMLAKTEIMINCDKQRTTVGNHITPALPRGTICYLATTSSILKLDLIEALKLRDALTEIIMAELHK